MQFPSLPSDEEMQRQLNENAGMLSPITVCQDCGSKNFMHRLGCGCGGKVKWLWMDGSGSVIECGVDFSPIEG